MPKKKELAMVYENALRPSRIEAKEQKEWIEAELNRLGRELNLTISPMK